MGYVGNEPDVGFTSFAQQTITGNGGTSYTLSHAVANGKEILLYINNIKQEEGSSKAYTASGTTLTLSEAISSSDSCYCVFLGKALQTTVAPDGSVTSAKLANANLEMPNTLDMNGNELILDADGDTSITADTDDQVDIKVSGSDKVTINSSGIGIGNTSPDQLLNLGNTSSSQPILQFLSSTSGANTIHFGDGSSTDAYRGYINYAHNDDSLEFASGGSERMSIGSNGHLYATNADTSLANLTLRKSAGDTIDYLQCRKTDNDLRIVLEGSGDVHNATGTFSAISDKKLKENIADASSQWDDIKNIRIRKFSLKADKSSEANMIGVIAQELENVSPNLVKERIDRDPDTGEDLGTTTKIVKYSILHTKAVKALQEAMARIETLEAKVKELESK